ncbi:MAG: hypothetical protein JSS81_01580 [Acidobacteria bacterium]|nr:hypothetical protein [Acidobacteriota bacterium]
MRHTLFFKGLILPVLLLVFIGSAGPAIFGQCLTPPSGLTGWWAGDGSPLDNRGPNHATFVNGPVYAAGEVNQAFSFNGTNQYLAIPQTADLPVRGTNSFTIEAWVRHLGDDSPSIFNLFAYRSGGDDVQFIITRTEVVVWATTAYGVIMRFPHGVDPTVWNHFAFTRSGNIWRAYVNGGQVGTDLNVNVNLPTPSTTQNVGTTGGADTQFALGMLDEFSLYSRALTQPEILAVYNAGAGGKCPQYATVPVGLVSWWQADDNALDSRGQNHGQLQNGADFATGKAGRAFNFDGIDDYVEVPHSSSLDITGAITMEAWFRQNAVGFGTILSKGDGNCSVGTCSYDLQISETGADGKITFVLYGGYPGDHYVTTASLIVPNRWYHLAVTWDGTTANPDNVRLYLNGVFVQSWTKTTPLAANTQNLSIGSKKPPTFYGPFNGQIDEVGIYNRALSLPDIQKLFISGSKGKYAPTATVPTAVPFGWWPGDGDSRDISGNNLNGTLVNGAGYAVGKVGQSFDFDGVDDYLNAGTIGLADRSFSIELWARRKTLGGAVLLVGQGSAAGQQGLHIGWRSDSSFTMDFFNDGLNISDTADLNWHHWAFTFDRATNTKRIYKDGVQTGPNGGGGYFQGGGALWFGRSPWSYNEWVNGAPINAQIDEPSVYVDRVLNATEIYSIYNAGLAGKYKSVYTPVGFLGRRPMIPPSVTTSVGDAAITVTNFTMAGTTQEVPLAAAKLPPLLPGYLTTGLFYDIATTAVYTGSPKVCFRLPALTPQFSYLRLLHLENGVWIDRTSLPATSPLLCSTSLTGLSPFAIVYAVPTAARVTVGGRITANLTGLGGIRVTLTDNAGVARTALTNSFGYYRFENVEVGGIYVVQAASKKYEFGNPLRVIYVGDELSDVDFEALE